MVDHLPSKRLRLVLESLGDLGEKEIKLSNSMIFSTSPKLVHLNQY